VISCSIFHVVTSFDYKSVWKEELSCSKLEHDCSSFQSRSHVLVASDTRTCYWLWSWYRYVLELRSAQKLTCVPTHTLGEIGTILQYSKITY
jgi:hypothetical protein